MTSYSVFPRQEQALERFPSPRSRFVEGSMNDRVSNVPPIDFLGGPAEIDAYERQFFLGTSSSTTASSAQQHAQQQHAQQQHQQQQPQHQHQQQPISNGSTSVLLGGKRSSFLAPLLNGVREKFHMSRAKSASHIKTKSSFSDARAEPFGPPTPGSFIENMSTPGYYPSREEVMENYKSLVDAGFFSSHAIQGTRHNPPPGFGAAAAAAASADTKERMEAPLPSPPATETTGLPFAQRMQMLNNASAPRPFTAMPSSATQQFSSADATVRAYPPSPERKQSSELPQRPSFPHAHKKQAHSSSSSVSSLMPPPPAPNSSPSRGIKRGMADMAGGPAERWEMAGNGSGGSGGSGGNGNGGGAEGAGSARKLVKKLRKSASRVSADLTRPITSYTHGSDDGDSVMGEFGGLSANPAVDGSIPPLPNHLPSGPASGPGAGGSGLAMGLVRKVSNSFRKDGAGWITSTAAGVAGGEGVASITTTGGKLHKARRALGRRVSVSKGHSRSNSTSIRRPPVSYNPQVPQQLAQQLASVVMPHNSTGYPFSVPTSPTVPTQPVQPEAAPAVQDGDEDTMMIDSPLPPSPPPPPPTTLFRHSTDLAMSGSGGDGDGPPVPSFHYPQRQKKPNHHVLGSGGGGPIPSPLSAVLDANRCGSIRVISDSAVVVRPSPSPLRFAGKYGKTDSFGFGAGMGPPGLVRERVVEVGKENCEVFGPATC